MKIACTTQTYPKRATKAPSTAPEKTSFSYPDSFQPSTALGWTAFMGGHMALLSAPVAAGAGLVTAALTNNPTLGVKVGLGVLGAGALAGGALGCAAYHVGKNINIAS